MRLGLQRNILAIAQRVTLCMIQISVEPSNYQTMSRLIYLGGSLIIMLASFYPLLSLIDSLGNVHELSTLAIGLIVVWLVVALIFGLLLFYFTWSDIIEEEEEKYIQLHFKGAVYTVPEIYQVKGLHNSSSLYKITNRIGEVQVLGGAYLNEYQVYACIPSFDTLAQLVEQQIFNLWVMGSNPICITIDDSVNL